MTETSPFIEINGQQLDVRREDIAPAIANATRTQDLTHSLAQKSQRKAEAAGAVLAAHRLRPLPKTYPGGVRFFYQIDPQLYSNGSRIMLYRVAPSEMPTRELLGLDLPPASKKILPFGQGSGDLRWPCREQDRILIENHLQTIIETGDAQKPLSYPAAKSPPLIISSTQTGLQDPDIDHDRHMPARHGLLTQFNRALGVAHDKLPKWAKKNHELLLRAYQIRNAIEEEKTITEYFAVIDSDKADPKERMVDALKNAGLLGHENLYWLFHGRRRNDPVSEESSAEDIRKRVQFVASMPFFAALALDEKYCGDGSRADLIDIARLIRRGEETLKINPDGSAGRGLELFGRSIANYARGVATGNEWRRTVGSRLSLLAMQNPRLLRAVCKLNYREVGTIQEILEIIAALHDRPPAQFPKTLAEWKMARILCRQPSSATAQKMIDEFAPHWSKTNCFFQAELARRDQKGGDFSENVRALLSDTDDYTKHLFNSLILPAAVNISPIRYGVWPDFSKDADSHEKLYQRFMECYTARNLLDGNAQYHRPHILAAYQATLLPHERANENGLHWPALTVNFIVPHGTFRGNIDIGGTEIRWLTTPKELAEEGDAQRNCVKNYAQSCLLGACHILSIKPPKGKGPATTLELRENTDFGKTTLTILQHRSYGNRPIKAKSYNDTVACWLAHEINQAERLPPQERKNRLAVLPSAARHTLTAPLDPQTGLPVFAAIDFAALEKKRRENILRLTRPDGKNLIPTFTYHPRKKDAVDEVFAAAKNLKLLPPRLNDAQTPQELLAQMGVEVQEGRLIFHEPRQPRQQPRLTGPAPPTL